MGKVIYTPVFSKIFNPTITFDGKEISWWTKKALIHYDAVLVSTYYGIDEPRFRRLYEMSDALVVADSGGLQWLTKNWRENIIKIVRWQENNADIALTFDATPKIDIRPGAFVVTDDKTFRERCELSKKYYQLMKDNRAGRCKFLKIIHGHTPERFAYWYEQIKDIELDGICISPTFAEQVYQHCFQLAFIHEKESELKNLHILVGTSEQVLPFIIWVSKFFDKTIITFDSSTFAKQGSQFRLYWIPPTYMRFKVILATRVEKIGLYLGRKLISRDINLDSELPCNCPVCKKVKTWQGLLTAKSDDGKFDLTGRLIALHNLYQTLTYINLLKRLNKSKLLEDWILEYFGKESDLAKAVEIFSYYLSKGYDKMLKKYENCFSVYEKVKVVKRDEAFKQTSLL